MNNIGDIKVIGNTNKQQNEKEMCNLKSISKSVDRISMFCTFVAISIFGAIFFDLTNNFDYSNVILIRDWAYYLVLLAVLFYFLAIILSQFINEDSQQTKGIVLNTAKGMILIENKPTTKVSSENSKQKTVAKLTYTKCLKGTVTDNVKPTNTTSGTPQPGVNSKKNKTEVKPLLSNVSCKNQLKTKTSKRGKIGERTSPLMSFKSFKKFSPSQKSEKVVKASSTNTPSKVQQHAGSPRQTEIGANIYSPIRQTENLSTANNMPIDSSQFVTYFQSLLEANPLPAPDRNILYSDPTNTPFESQQGYNNWTNSPNRLSDMQVAFQSQVSYYQSYIPPGSYAYYPTTGVFTNWGFSRCPNQHHQGGFGAEAFNSYTESQYFNVNYQRQLESPSPVNTNVFPSAVYCHNILPTNTSGYLPTTEVFAQENFSVFPGGVAESHTSGYLPTTEVFASENFSVFPGGVAQSQAEYTVRQTNVFQYPRDETFSPCIRRPNQPTNNQENTLPSMSNERCENEVSDVQTKFQSMSFSQ